MTRNISAEYSLIRRKVKHPETTEKEECFVGERACWIYDESIKKYSDVLNCPYYKECLKRADAELKLVCCIWLGYFNENYWRCPHYHKCLKEGEVTSICSV